MADFRLVDGSEAVEAAENRGSNGDIQGSNSVSVNSRLENSRKPLVLSRNLTPNQCAFLAAYAETGTVSCAAKAAGIDRRNHGVWLTDPVYKRAFQSAVEEAADNLEREARRRAVEGVEEPTGWYKGSPGGFVRKYSDVLLIFLLKGARPEKYKDRVEQTGIQALLRVDPKDLSEDQLHQLGEFFLRGAIGSEDPVAIEQAKREIEAGHVVIDAQSSEVAETVEDKTEVEETYDVPDREG